MPASLLNTSFILATLVSLASEGCCVLFLVDSGYQLCPTVHLFLLLSPRLCGKSRAMCNPKLGAEGPGDLPWNLPGTRSKFKPESQNTEGLGTHSKPML